MGRLSTSLASCILSVFCIIEESASVFVVSSGPSAMVGNTQRTIAKTTTPMDKYCKYLFCLKFIMSAKLQKVSRKNTEINPLFFVFALRNVCVVHDFH